MYKAQYGNKVPNNTADPHKYIIQQGSGEIGSNIHWEVGHRKSTKKQENMSKLVHKDTKTTWQRTETRVGQIRVNMEEGKHWEQSKKKNRPQGQNKIQRS